MKCVDGKYNTNANPVQVLTVVWNANENTVCFDVNGGTGSMTPMKGNTDSTITLNAGTFMRTGYMLIGWSDEPNGALLYDNGGAYKVTANPETTLYAVWKQTTNSLTVNSSNNAVISNVGGIAYYTFTPSSTGKYVIYSTSDTDTKVYLYNSSGTQLSSDDDSGDGQNFRLQYNLTAGTTYRFGVQYYNSSN